LIYAW